MMKQMGEFILAMCRRGLLTAAHRLGLQLFKALDLWLVMGMSNLGSFSPF